MLFRKMAIKQREKEIVKEATFLSQTPQTPTEERKDQNSSNNRLQYLDDQTASGMLLPSDIRGLIRGLTVCLLQLSYDNSDTVQAQQLQLHLKYLVYGLSDMNESQLTVSDSGKRVEPSRIRRLSDIVTLMHHLQHRDNITVTRCIELHNELETSLLEEINKLLEKHRFIKQRQQHLGQRSFNLVTESFCQIFMLNCSKMSQQCYRIENLTEIRLVQEGIVVILERPRKLEKSRGLRNLNEPELVRKISIEYDARAVISEESLEVHSLEDSEIVARNLFADTSFSRSILEQNQDQTIIIGRDGYQVEARPACSLICQDSQQQDLPRIMQMPFKMIRSIMAGQEQIVQPEDSKHNISRDSLSTKFKPISSSDISKYKHCKSNTVSTSALSTPEHHILDLKMDRPPQQKPINSLLPLQLLATQPILRNRIRKVLALKQ